MAIKARFWAKVEVNGPDDCWPWTGALRNGYGCLGLGGRGDGIDYAHRISYALANGPIPAGLDVMHSCDYRPCVNPAHLSVGTRANNMSDAAAKGRMRPGPRVTACKYGHGYTPENTGIGTNADGKHLRWCRACKADASRARYKELK